MGAMQGSMQTKSDTVKFLNKEYTIPSDVEKYVKLLLDFEKMQDILNEEIRKEVKSYGSIFVQTDKVPALFESSARQVIKMLCDNGIYGRTAEDYMDNNEGYKFFCETNILAGKQALQDIVDELKDFGAGWQAAESKANASVTGSGINVFSSSFTTLAVAAAFDYSCSRNQCQKADTQYRKEIQFLTDATSTATERKQIDYLNKTYFVNAELAVSMFVFGMMDLYVKDISDIGRFDTETVKYIDFKKSQGLLKNLKISNDKKAVLKLAFLACPFNPSIYEEAENFNLCDPDTLLTACKYCPGNTIAEKVARKCKIEDNCRDFSKEYDRIIPYLPIVASYMGTTESAAIKAVFEASYDRYIGYLSSFSGVANSSGNQIKEFVRLNILPYFSDLYLVTREEIQDNISKFVYNLISDKDYAFLVHLGFDFSQFNKDYSNQSVRDYWVNTLTEAAFAFISECRLEQESLDKLKTDYDAEVKNQLRNIEKMEEKLQSLGLLAFSKKRALSEEIEEAKKTFDHYCKQADYNKRKTFFEDHFM